MEKKTKILRMLAIHMAVLLAVSVCCSCDSSSKKPDGTDSEAVVQDLGGYEFTWATIWNWANYPEAGATEYGDKRLAWYEEIEKKYNCKIKRR